MSLALIVVRRHAGGVEKRERLIAIFSDPLARPVRAVVGTETLAASSAVASRVPIANASQSLFRKLQVLKPHEGEMTVPFRQKMLRGNPPGRTFVHAHPRDARHVLKVRDLNRRPANHLIIEAVVPGQTDTHASVFARRSLSSLLRHRDYFS